MKFKANAKTCQLMQSYLFIHFVKVKIKRLTNRRERKTDKQYQKDKSRQCKTNQERQTDSTRESQGERERGKERQTDSEREKERQTQ